MLRRLIREDIELRTVLDPGLRLIKADPGQLEQCIVNLVVNARDAMPVGGTITVETTNVRIGQSSGNIVGGLPNGDYIRLAVRDSGCGMTPDVKARIFEPFFTTKAKGSGTGLGLATVYGIVKQSGGHISADSEPGRGTSFNIHFPLAEGKLSILNSTVLLNAMPKGQSSPSSGPL